MAIKDTHQKSLVQAAIRAACLTLHKEKKQFTIQNISKETGYDHRTIVKYMPLKLIKTADSIDQINAQAMLTRLKEIALDNSNSSSDKQVAVKAIDTYFKALGIFVDDEAKVNVNINNNMLDSFRKEYEKEQDKKV